MANNICGCDKPVDAKCVKYFGECLQYLNVCDGEDLYTILHKLDSLLKIILIRIGLEDGDDGGVLSMFQGTNVGNGSKIYKGPSTIGLEQFRTMIAQMPVVVTQNQNTIEFSIDEDVLKNIILNYTELMASIDSPTNTILVDGYDQNSFHLDLNPNTFVEGNGILITVLSNPGGTSLVFSIDPVTLENVKTKLKSVGDGHPIYSGPDVLDANKEKIRTIDITADGADVQQSYDPNGGLVFNISVPTFKDPSYPSYFINIDSPVENEEADGTAQKPYKTWDYCKTQIIGNGTFSDPEHKNTNIIFQKTVVSSTDLTLADTTFHFDTNSEFIYEGTEPYVFDMKKIIQDTDTINGVNGIERVKGTTVKFSGSGIITSRDNSNQAPLNIIRAAGADTMGGPSFLIEFVNGSNITLREKDVDNSFFENIDSPTTSGMFLRNSVGDNIKFLKKTASVHPRGGFEDVLPIDTNNAILSSVGKNPQVPLTLIIRESAQVTIECGINRAILSKSSNSTPITDPFVVFGSINIIPFDNKVRYGKILSLEGSSDIVPSPSLTTGLIVIENSTILVSSLGKINTSYPGGARYGGYNAVVELIGESSFIYDSYDPLIVSTRSMYNNLLFFDTSPNSKIRINNIFADIGIRPELIDVSTPHNYYLIYYTDTAFPTNTEISFGGIQVDNTNIIQEDAIYRTGPSSGNYGQYRINSEFLDLCGVIYSTKLQTYATNSDARTVGNLKQGMFYVKNITDGGDDYYELRVVK